MSRIQILVSGVNQDIKVLPKKMNIQSDAVVVNQCQENSELEADYKKDGEDTLRIKWLNRNERGIGLSRNLALDNADHEFLQFADEDIVYDEGYTSLVEKEFDDHPAADMILFNVKAQERDLPQYRFCQSQLEKLRKISCICYCCKVSGDKKKRSQILYSLWRRC